MVVFALTLIRHGETAHNKEKIIQGQSNIPLSQTGLKQSELLGVYLQYQHYSHVYTSDLTRAKQTAESIVKLNKSFKGCIVDDQRLRERNLGSIEGKSLEYFKEAATKTNQDCCKYTPPGGETVQQMRERVVSFFHDLCETAKEWNTTKPMNDSDSELNISRILQGKERQSGQKRKWEKGESFDESNFGNLYGNQNKICVKDLQSAEMKMINNISGNNCLNVNDILSESKEILSINKKCDNIISEQDEHPHDNIFGNPNQKYPDIFSENAIHSKIELCTKNVSNIECPNVSLSPLVEQSMSCLHSLHNFSSLQNATHDDSENPRRLSVCSSCDDGDIEPTLTANILVVSHGGWLRELFRYFFEDLGCLMPGGKKQALRFTPNTGLSKFTISFEEQGEHPKIICLQIHDKHHLNSSVLSKMIISSDAITL